MTTIDDYQTDPDESSDELDAGYRIECDLCGYRNSATYHDDAMRAARSHAAATGHIDEVEVTEVQQ